MNAQGKCLAAIALLACAPAMAQDNFIGEVRWVGFNFAPQGWAQCDGQLLPISQNTALFSLLGTQFGGDGRVTFALPDLRGRDAIHQGQGPGLSLREMGQQGGAEAVTLTENEMPVHSHTAYAANGLATRPTVAGSYIARLSTDSGGTPVASDVRAFRPTGLPVAMNGGMIGPAGGGQPHENMAPYTTLNCIIALQGIFPARQ